jgi:hypothetical protein
MRAGPSSRINEKAKNEKQKKFLAGLPAYGPADYRMFGGRRSRGN